MGTTPSHEQRLSFDRRKWVRSDLALPAIVSSGSRNYSARVMNIAPKGAMLEVSAPVVEGTSLFLRCGSIDAHAVVVRMHGLQIGILFSTPLSERQIGEQLSRAAAVTSLRLRMPGRAAANNN